ncbi:MAG: hypothetical protein ACRDIY_09460 [Chloroflexota bacterium]
MKQSATLDSSFWINAHRSGLVSHLLDAYELFYEPTVAAERDKAFPSGREFWRLARQGFLTARPAITHRVREFGVGERAAMSLALDHPGWLLFLDDYRPYQAAVRLGIRVVCTPVLVVSFFVDGRLDTREALFALARLAALQTVSPHLLAAALAQVARTTQPREGGQIGHGA